MEQTSLDGSSGEIIDTSVNGNNATSGGGLITRIEDPAIAGNPGTCRYGDFDGVDDLVTDTNAGDYLNGLEAITVMAWVYNTDELAGNDRGVFFTDDPSGQDNRLGLRYDTDGLYGDGNNVIKASVFTDECDATDECLQVETVSDVMVQDQWQHVAMTWTTQGEIKVYVDGAEVETSGTRGSGGTGALASIERLDIGEGAKGDRWQGRIDEFRIYGVALTEAEIMAEMSRAFPCSGFGPNHIRLSHPGEGLTCSSSQITVSACANEDCSELFGEPVEVELTSPFDGWTPNPVTFTGRTDVDLSVTQPSTISLDANAVNPSAQELTRCFNGGTETCEMDFFDTGFVINVPDHIAAVTTASTIAAVRKDDDSQQCVPGFSNETREVGFWSGYSDPATGSTSVSVDSDSISQTSPGTGIELQFNANGIATFDLSYPDVGRLSLNARYEGSSANGDEGLVMAGTTEFVVRPDRFLLDVPGNPGATDANGGVFTAAGEAFEVTVSALNANGDQTPNFGQEATPESVRLESSLVAPAGGDAPFVKGSFGAFGEACDGSAAAAGSACGEFSWPEVGIFALTPRLAAGSGYLGTEDVIGTRLDYVGRFIPARFDITVSEQGIVEPFCTAGAADFAYTGQDLSWESGFAPIIIAEARTVSGGVAQNYTRGGFMKLDELDLIRAPAASDSSAIDAQGDPFPVTATLSGMALSNLGAGRVQYVFSASDTLSFDKAVDSRVAPFTPDYSIALSALMDSDMVSAAPQTPVNVRPSFGFDVRYGRLNLENAYGPEISGLTVPFNAEYYTGAAFALNAADSCWAYNTGADVVLDDSGLSGGSTSVDSKADTLASGVPPSGSELKLTAPGQGNTGDVSVTFGVPSWLKGDFDGDGGLENPSALATFGVYRGHDRVIYWQER
ncbi:LamG domain-containing protein [Marinobacter similis]|uniref:LamG domain-containing protein n=1 Tax=Marinobacter similis TaxID=1420916 RepID=UPI000A84D4F7|nr:LamG domain-containing protein [Marinobacter similis]